MELNKIYVAEYSISQGAWNIDTLENIIKINNDMKENGINNDYKILMVDTDEEKLRERLKERIINEPTE